MNVWEKETAGMAWQTLENDVTIQRDLVQSLQAVQLEVFLVSLAKLF